MTEKPSMGLCQHCGKTFNRVSMSRHLNACGVGTGKASPGLVVFVESRYGKSYWMHVAVPEKSTLYELDDFLRKTWLECCGHMSGFTIAGVRCASHGMDDFAEGSMESRLSRVLGVGDRFYYDYDYGSTTSLALKVVGRRNLDKPRDGVVMLSRNLNPEFICEQCKSQPATQICTECVWNSKGWLCSSCAAAHECGTEMFLPVVNSPRTGVCVYSG